MNCYHVPTKIYHGEEALKSLATLDMKQVFVICDPFMEKSGMVCQVTQQLEQLNVPYTVFSNIIPDPTIEIVSEGIEQLKQVVPDTIIAFGGGSAIDAAKAIGQIYHQMNPTTSKLQFVAIPTTSGTGSEVTSFAVITDNQTKTKYPLVDDAMLPDVAILDPKFVVSVPANITADTGMDVLTHSFEAYVSTIASIFSDACAEKAIKLVWSSLVDATKNGQDLEKRELMHDASCLAGIAFNHASLGICHSLAHAVGARFHIPHGRANAMLLPHVIAYNAGLDLSYDTPALERYAQIAHLVGIQAGTKRATVHLLISGLYRMMKQMNIPKDVIEFGIDPQEFIEAIPDMAKRALADNCTPTNPRVPTQKDLEMIYGELCRKGQLL